ncbi:MAG: ATP-binding protein [Pseudomonadota bacterium]
MSGAGSSSSQPFQVAQIHAPAAVLLSQLQDLDKDESLNALTTLLQNPVLLAKVLESQAKAIKAPRPLRDRLTEIDPVSLARTLRNGALQQVLQNQQVDVAFIHEHWKLSRFSALIAQELALTCKHPEAATVTCSAFLLRMGMLVLEQQHGQAYSELVLGTANQTELLRAEQENLGIDHIIAGERLLEAWQLDPFCIDAMRYQALPAETVIDAAPLVKICWFANYLCNNKNAEAAVITKLAESLFNLSSIVITELLAKVQVQYAQECSAYGLGSGKAAEQSFSSAAARGHAEQLKQYVVSSTILSALAMEPSSTAASLKVLLVNLLLEAGIEPKFIVFAQDNASTPFHAITSNNVHQNAAGLTFQCATGRNVLSEIVASGGFIISGGYASLADPSLALTSKELTVIDRQVLDLLGGQTVLCETIPTEGTARALLLIGIPFSSGNLYLARTGVRQLIRKKIAGFVEKQDDEGLSASTMVYQQRVREAVHEANNPLTIIKNYLQILSMKQGAQNETTEDIKLIKSEIDRVARILIGLRESREIEVKPQQININQLLEKMRLMFTLAAGEGKNVAIKFDLAPTNPGIWGKPDALKQILTNLVKNAAEAISKSGNINLITKGNIYLRDQIFVQLCITDDGPGIAPQVMSKLFTTGTSTKGDLHTGAGLAIVNKLVADMQGQISCQSDNNGTVFSILLPQVR